MFFIEKGLFYLMVYKKYVKKRGKVFGPYYYKSYREGNSIKKIYIGGEKEYKLYLQKQKNSVEQPLKRRAIVKRSSYLLLLLFLIGLSFIFLSFSVINDNFEGSIVPNSYDFSTSRILGFVITENQEEIVDSFDNELDLEIKGPPKFGNLAVSKNKNKRMDFDIEGGLRLYFDLLNYSNFVEATGEALIEEGIVRKEEIVKEIVISNVSDQTNIKINTITGNMISFVRSITGNVVSNQKISIEEVDISKVREKIDDLDEEKIDEISNQAVIDLNEEEFDVDVNETAARENNVDYKWGYKVVLKDLNFMAKVDVTSDQKISVVNDDTLKIGNHLLNFKDLVDEGYSVRIGKPKLASSLPNETAKDRRVTNVIVNKSLANKSIDNLTEGSMEESSVISKNESEEELKKEKKEKKKLTINETITGNVIRFIFGIGRGIIGNVVDLDLVNQVEVQDLEYKNIVTIYIERDFKGTGYKKGDIITLDPTIIKIKKASHLDKNRIFISDIFEEVKEKDNIWSEVINESHYVRVIFEKNLTNKNDITIYARVFNHSNLSNQAEIRVYRKNDTELVTSIFNITSDNWYRTYLTGLKDNESYNTFDLKIVSNAMEFDYIVDPTNINTSFVNPTPVNDTTTSNTSLIFNISIENGGSLSNVTWNWNGTNFTIFDNKTILYFNFDNVSALGENDTNNVTFDISNYGNNGTCTDESLGTMNCTWNVSGRYGAAIQLNGVEEYIDVASTIGYIYDNMTVMAWVNPDASGGGKIVSTGDDDDTDSASGWSLGLSGVNNLTFLVAEAFDDVITITSDVNITNETWHHVVGIANGSDILLYVDGILQSQTASFVDIEKSGTGLTIGAGFTTATLTTFFDGLIDEVIILNKSLTDEEVYQFYVSNLKKYDTTNWSLYVNQSKNATDGLDAGVYSYYGSATDSSGNENRTRVRSITIGGDTTPPDISITNPSVNNSNTTDIGLDINFTVSDDTSLDSCWWSNDSFTINNSITCGQNITAIIWSEGLHNVTVYANDSSNNLNFSTISFTVDITSPNITLLDPEDSKSYTASSQEIVFGFNVTETNYIDNCSLIVDSQINSTNSLVNKSLIQNFTVIFGTGTYTWNVNCTDSSGNVGNGSQRSFTITAPSSGGGGGGGTRILKQNFSFNIENSIENEKITVSLKQGETKKQEITIENTGDLKVKISLDNRLKQFLEINPDSFYLDKSESQTVSLIFNAKENTVPKVYTGEIFIEGGGIKRKILLAVEVESIEPLFDVILTIPEKYKVIIKGENMVLETDIKNLGDPISDKIGVNYIIKDLEGNIIIMDKDLINIEDELFLTKEIRLPRSLKEGNYIAIIEVIYQDLKAVSSRFFQVKRPEYILLEFDYGNGDFELIGGSLEKGWSPTISHDPNKKYRFNLYDSDEEILYTVSIDDPGFYFSELFVEDEIEGGLKELELASFYITAPEKRESEKFQILLRGIDELKSSEVIVSEGNVYDIGAKSCRVR